MRILFVSTEVWSEKNPEGIVARKLINGLLENNCTVDILTTNPTSLLGINNEILVPNNSSELLSKVQKKVVGIEKKKFVDYVKRNLDKFNILNYDIVITRSEPFYLHEIGFYIKSRYPSIKWVASFGDPVFLNPYNSTSLIKCRVAKKLELKYWSMCDLVTHTNQTVIDEYAKHGFDIKKSMVLENPFVIFNPPMKRDNSAKLPIVFGYIGSLYGKRKIDPVIKFLSKLNFDFSLQIIGGVRNTYYENRFGSLTKYLMKKDTEKIYKPIRDFNMLDKVELKPFMSKSDLDLFINSHIDVLINIDAPIGTKNIFLSSKIVEYLQYRKPILNFTIEGASVDFLKSVGVDFYYNLNENSQKEFTKDMIHQLLPSRNIEYFTTQQVCCRLLNYLNKI